MSARRGREGLGAPRPRPSRPIRAPHVSVADLLSSTAIAQDQCIHDRELAVWVEGSRPDRPGRGAGAPEPGRAGREWLLLAMWCDGSGQGGVLVAPHPGITWDMGEWP